MSIIIDAARITLDRVASRITTMQIAPDLVAAFAPTGVLRVAINLGNPILANRGADGQAVGVSVDLGRALAVQLGVDIALVVVDAAGKSVDIVSDESADIGFFAIDPVRGAKIAFTAPYVLIEGTYLVRDDDPIRGIDEVDRPGKRIVVGQGSAYDLFLTREIAHAGIVRVPGARAVIDTFLQDPDAVAAGVRQVLEADARRVPGLRILDGRFMTIRQAVGVPKSRGAAAAAYLANFVETMKISGFVAACLARHRIEGASVAPAGD